MSGRFLLDTNIVIAFFAQDEGVLDNMQISEAFYIPSIVLGELYFGAIKSSNQTQNRSRVDQLVPTTSILGCDAQTARAYGQLKDDLRQKGRPIPENDIWIAAIALQNELTLVTRDAHFDHIDEITITAW